MKNMDFACHLSANHTLLISKHQEVRELPHGSVMVGVLMLIIIIALATVASLQSSVVDFRVSINSQASFEASNLAEEALVTAELFLKQQLEVDNIVIKDLMNLSGFHDYTAVVGQDDINWNDSQSIRTISESETSSNAFVVQYLGVYPRYGESTREQSAATIHSPADVSHYFRIIALGSSKAGAKRQLIGVYRHDDIKDYR